MSKGLLGLPANMGRQVSKGYQGLWVPKEMKARKESKGYQVRKVRLA